MIFPGKREVKALPVRCDNVDRTCKWVGTVDTIDDHVAECEYTPVLCPNKCNEEYGTVLILRKDLEGHLRNECPNRKHECSHCKINGTYYFITQVHDNICGEKLIRCTQKECLRTLKRARVDDHLRNDCEYVVQPCKYENIGCGMKLRRKDMRWHEDDDKLHLHQALTAVVELRDDLDYALTTIATLNDAYTLKEGEAFTFKVTEFEQKKTHSAQYNSPPFYTSSNGYKISIEVFPNGVREGARTHVSVFVSILQGKYDDDLSWPFNGGFTIQLLNQKQDSNHHSAIFRFNYHTVGKIWGYQKFISHSELYDCSFNTQMLKYNTIHFRVNVTVGGYKSWLNCTTSSHENYMYTEDSFHVTLP